MSTKWGYLYTQWGQKRNKVASENSWENSMDNGYINRTKNHQTSKVVGFLGRSVACPDKTIGKIF